MPDLMRHNLQQRFALLELLLKLRSGSVDAFSEIAQPALGVRVEPHGPVAASQFADRVLQASQPANEGIPTAADAVAVNASTKIKAPARSGMSGGGGGGGGGPATRKCARVQRNVDRWRADLSRDEDRLLCRQTA